MIDYTCPSYAMLKIVGEWARFDEKLFDCFSMEQTWLAFVMKEKYNKLWVNDEWVDANEYSVFGCWQLF